MNLIFLLLLLLPFDGFRDILIDWKANTWRYNSNYDRNFFLCYERKPVDSIELINDPKKTNYQTDDVFVPSELKVKLKYIFVEDTEPYYEELEYDSNEKLFSFEPSLDSNLNNSYDKIKITCLEKDVYVNIFVEPENASISICKNIKYLSWHINTCSYIFYVVAWAVFKKQISN